MESIVFNPDQLAERLKSEIPEIAFAYLMGSAKSGFINPHSDLDIALYLNTKPSFKIFTWVQRIVDESVGDVRADTGFLNNAEPIYRFESLKGRLLFTRDESMWIDFYSLTCREYESQIFDYEKQQRYRLEAHS